LLADSFFRLFLCIVATLSNPKSRAALFTPFLDMYRLRIDLGYLSCPDVRIFDRSFAIYFVVSGQVPFFD
jgi:hypothetical protein